MILSKESLRNISTETGFRTEIIEKVVLLLDLLNNFSSNNFLKDKFVLKGGTALNLFYFDIPRLSVDIDINFTGYEKKEQMIKIRTEFENQIENEIKKQGLLIRGKKVDYALASYHLRYKSTNINFGNLKVDVNYMMRIPLYDIEILNSKNVGDFSAENIPILNKDELFASKLVATFARDASRDIYDVYNLMSNNDTFNFKKVKIAFIVYGAMNSFDFRNISEKDLFLSERDFKNKLIPVVKSKSMIKEKSFYQEIERTCEKIIAFILPYGEKELEFIEKINEHGIIEPKLITENENLCRRILNQPQLVWKCKNVKGRKGK